MELHSRVCAEINLDALDHNLDEIKRLIAPETGVIAVIKTNGYGHGAVELAKRMEDRAEIWGYAVATAEEAMELKENGMKKPMLILGYVFPEHHEFLVRENVRSAVFSLEMAKKLQEKAARQQKILPIHIKLDTGMSRIGFQVTREQEQEILAISKLPNLSIEGIFTHFAKADEWDKAFTADQVAAYEQMVQWLEDDGVSIPIHHVSNSAGIVDLPAYNKNLVRAGIILYGLWPSDEVQKENIDLQPLLTLKSHVAHVKTLDDGRTISYGGTYRVEGAKRIATIPVGYGDGYPRGLSNKGYVLIRGQKAAICGRVCMDQFMVDVTDIPDVRQGDEVILVGESLGARITVEELGDISGRFNYEFTCDLGRRIPRVYVSEKDRNIR